MRITVNGTEHDVDGTPLSYAALVRLARPLRWRWYLETSGAVLTIVFSTPRDAEGRSRSGSVPPGGSVTPEEGMRFHAADTGGA